MTDATLRRAHAVDAPALAEIGARTFVETFGHLYAAEDLAEFLATAYSLEKTRADLANPAAAAWLVEANGQVIGHAQCGSCDLPHPDVTAQCRELKRFYLVRTAQSGGIGGRLFRVCLDWMLEDGPRDLWIGVWSENHGALRFYGRQGFDKVGEYGFQVGTTTDHEFILRRSADSFSNNAHRSSVIVSRNP